MEKGHYFGGSDNFAGCHDCGYCCLQLYEQSGKQDA